MSSPQTPRSSPSHFRAARSPESELTTQSIPREIAVRHDPMNLRPFRPTHAPSSLGAGSPAISDEEISGDTSFFNHHTNDMWDPYTLPMKNDPIAFRQRGPSIPCHACFPCFEDGVGVLFRLVNFSTVPSSSIRSASHSPAELSTSTQPPPSVDGHDSVPAVGSHPVMEMSVREQENSADSAVGDRNNEIPSQSWAFYNDTSDTLVRVVAKFGAGSRLSALGSTRLVALPEKMHGDAESLSMISDINGAVVYRGDGGVVPQPSGQSPASITDPVWVYQATLEILPEETQLFTEGIITSFFLDFHTEALPANNVVFENGAPSVEYHKVYPCFKHTGNGLLFRLVNMAENVWYFYNDTKEYNMRVVVDFAMPIEVEPLGDTVLRTREEPTPAVTYRRSLPHNEFMQTPVSSDECGSRLPTCKSSCTTAVGGGNDNLSSSYPHQSDSLPQSISISPVSEMLPQILTPFYGANAEDTLKSGIDGWSSPVSEENVSTITPSGTSKMTVPVSQYPNGCSFQLSIPPGVTAAFIRGNPSVYKLEVVANVCAPEHWLTTPEEMERNDGGVPQVPNVDDDHRHLDYALPPERIAAAQAREQAAGLSPPHLAAPEDRGMMEWHSRPMDVHTSESLSEGVGEPRYSSPVSPPSGVVAQHHTPGLERRPSETPMLHHQPCSPQEELRMHEGRGEALPGTSPHAPASLPYTPFYEDVPSPHRTHVTDPFPPNTPSFPLPFRHGVPDQNIIPHLSAVTPCFPEHGNGLLFHLVDTTLDIWAFYNDTVDLIMTAVVQMPLAASENVKLAPGILVDHRTIVRTVPVILPNEMRHGESPPSANTREVLEDVLITTAQIRPLETTPFLVNPPATFETFFSVMTLDEEQQMHARKN